MHCDLLILHFNFQFEASYVSSVALSVCWWNHLVCLSSTMLHFKLDIFYVSSLKCPTIQEWLADTTCEVSVWSVLYFKFVTFYLLVKKYPVWPSSTMLHFKFDIFNVQLWSVPSSKYDLLTLHFKFSVEECYVSRVTCSVCWWNHVVWPSSSMLHFNFDVFYVSSLKCLTFQVWLADTIFQVSIWSVLHFKYSLFCLISLMYSMFQFWSVLRSKYDLLILHFNFQFEALYDSSVAYSICWWKDPACLYCNILHFKFDVFYISSLNYLLFQVWLTDTRFQISVWSALRSKCGLFYLLVTPSSMSIFFHALIEVWYIVCFKFEVCYISSVTHSYYIFKFQFEESYVSNVVGSACWWNHPVCPSSTMLHSKFDIFYVSSLKCIMFQVWLVYNIFQVSVWTFPYISSVTRSVCWWNHL